MILVDDTTAVMEPCDLSALLEYSCSLPTGTSIGKRWKCDRNAYPPGPPPHPEREPEWWLGEYVEHPDPKLVGIVWRRVLLVED